MIVRMTDFIDRSMRMNDDEVDKERFRTERDKVSEEMLASGYDRRNEKLFNDVAGYIALHRMHSVKTGYMLMGTVGCGKTEGAMRIAAMLKIPFYTTGELLDMYGTPEYYGAVKSIEFFSNKPGDMVIDELGTEPRPFMYYGNKYNVMADVLRERYDYFKFYGARTIVTTNLTFEELEKAYGNRVESRCWEMFKIKQYSGKDYRKENKSN